MSFFSQRQLATKYTFSLMRANKIIQGREFKAFKKEKVPYLLGHQIETQYQRVRKLYKYLLSFRKNSPVTSLCPNNCILAPYEIKVSGVKKFEKINGLIG